jgi:hypothetical protein
MALTAIRYAAQNSVAIGVTADITGLEGAGARSKMTRTGPTATQRVLFCRIRNDGFAFGCHRPPLALALRQ